MTLLLDDLAASEFLAAAGGEKADSFGSAPCADIVEAEGGRSGAEFDTSARAEKENRP